MRATWQKWFGETVVAHATWELVIMRGLFAWLMWRLLPESVAYTAQPVPNGLGHWVNFAFLSDADLWVALRWIFGVALVGYAVGAVPVVTLGAPALILMAFGALENSQGAIGHHLQLTCMVALAQWGVYLAGAGEGWRRVFWPARADHQTAVHWAKIVIAASYVTSACVKLIASGGLWVVQLPDISLQLIKTHANVYYDTLRPADGWVANQLPQFISAHPNLTRLFFTPGLVLELLAFIALAGRGRALLLGGGLLAMHLLVRTVMNLSFSAHEWLLVIFLLNIPWWLACSATALRTRIFPRKPAVA